MFPHTLHPPLAISPDSLPLLMLTLGWLLCLPFKFWPLKAKATPLALFFDGVCIGVPNKGTGRGTAKPDHGLLAWDHRMLQRHVLWALLTYPWRERAKPLEGRVAAAHAGCCVFRVLCVVVFEWTFSYRGGRKLILGKKWPTCMHSSHKKYHQTTPMKWHVVIPLGLRKNDMP